MKETRFMMEANPAIVKISEGIVFPKGVTNLGE